MASGFKTGAMAGATGKTATKIVRAGLGLKDRAEWEAKTTIFLAAHRGFPDIISRDDLASTCNEIDSFSSLESRAFEAGVEAGEAIRQNPDAAAGIGQSLAQGLMAGVKSLKRGARAAKEGAVAASEAGSEFVKTLEATAGKARAKIEVARGKKNINDYGHSFNAIPNYKRGFYGRRRGNLTIRQKTRPGMNALNAEEINQMPTSDPRYGLYKGQFYLGAEAYDAIVGRLQKQAQRAKEIASVNNENVPGGAGSATAGRPGGGRRKTRKQKKSRRSKTRRN